MADGTQTTEDTTALVPVSLAHARAGLAAHPLAPRSVGLARFEEAAPPYIDQMATSSLGHDTADGGRRLWTVSKVPLYSPDGTVWPGAFGTRRDDTGAALGVVGPRYKPLQNFQLAEALDVAFRHLPPSERPRIVNAGALGGGAGFGAGDDTTQGARVFAQLALPAELSGLLHVPADRHSPTAAFLTLTNTHDGSSAAVIGASCVRIVCRNTWQMAHGEAKRRGGFSLKHTVGNVDAYRAKVSSWFKEIGAGYRTQGERMRAFSARSMKANAVDAAVAEILFGEVLPVDEQTKAQKANAEAIIEMIEGRDGEFVAAGDVTAYSVFQAVTAYEMHRRPARGELPTQTETRLWRVLTDDEIIPRAFAVLDAVIAN
jgi:hypothetical protein